MTNDYLNNLIDQSLPTNGQGQISAATVRSALKEIVAVSSGLFLDVQPVDSDPTTAEKSDLLTFLIAINPAKSAMPAPAAVSAGFSAVGGAYLADTRVWNGALLVDVQLGNAYPTGFTLTLPDYKGNGYTLSGTLTAAGKFTIAYH